ncbi:hypothetical protein COMNV_00433 [Commensalibacter sp. Nvir]|uniref:NUDIX hydrolase n=1 Tax=Commensalibacter sp. Nvir TaxID=3069817 RepID=UPI002D38130E|nr:hypothetical protein COMNV_00433 [Commensalibacter sp. Nvir]
MNDQGKSDIVLNQTELIAVLVAFIGDKPCVMTIDNGSKLPSGPFELSHKNLQAGLRDWIRKQTQHPIGFLEQLYTFADRNRIPDHPEVRTISISYLGLVRQHQINKKLIQWHDWYRHFPWEDWRRGKPEIIEILIKHLLHWANTKEGLTLVQHKRIAFLFGMDHYHWNEDLILQRYELLFEAGLVFESGSTLQTGEPMFADHRRILATAIARLRAKIKYKAVVFELMPEQFTLLQLQRNVEGLIGQTLHKSNFRRMIEQQGLIEETGGYENESRGRPAKLFTYRRSVMDERALSGSKLPLFKNNLN